MSLSAISAQIISLKQKMEKNSKNRASENYFNVNFVNVILLIDI